MVDIFQLHAAISSSAFSITLILISLPGRRRQLQLQPRLALLRS